MNCQYAKKIYCNGHMRVPNKISSRSNWQKERHRLTFSTDFWDTKIEIFQNGRTADFTPQNLLRITLL